MKLFKTILAAAFVLALAPTFAQAAKLTTKTTHTHVESFEKKSETFYNLSGWYVAGQAGISMPTTGALQDTAVYSGAVGYRLNNNFRVEAEAAGRKYDTSVTGLTGDVRLLTYTANVWYDFANSSRFTPYVGGGLGWATAKAQGGIPGGVSVTEHDTAFVYQAGAGVAYSLCKNIALTTEYRFVDTSRFDDIGDDVKAHEIRAGVRYSF